MRRHGATPSASPDQGAPAIDFKSLFEAMPGLSLVLTPDLRIAAVTDSYLSATLTRRDQILGRPLFEVFPDNPDDPIATGTRNLRASLERVLEHRCPDTMAVQQYDIRVPGAAGSGFEVRYWSPVNSPVLDAQGEVVLIVHQVQDVTEFVRHMRAAAEQERRTLEFKSRTEQAELEVFQRAQELQQVNETLRQSDRSLQMAIGAGEIGVWKWDLVADSVEMSDRARELLAGTTDPTLTAAAAFRETIHPEDKDRVMRQVRSAIEERREYRTEYRCIHPDGSIRWVSARGRAVDDANGRPTLMQGVVLDITEHRRQQDASRLLTSIVEHSEDAIISENLDGVIMSWNAGATRLFGYEANEVIGQSSSVIAPSTSSVEEEQVRALLMSGVHVHDLEAERRAKDGRRFQASLAVSAVRDQHGAIVGFSKIVRDITDRKRFEAELNEARRAAEAANRAKGEFLAHMSHEIRTPLNGVIGMLDLLEGGAVPERERRYASLARSSAESLTTVINDILDFSKIEAGKLEITVEEVSVQKAVEEAMGMLAPKASQKGLELAYHVHPSVPQTIRTDGDRVRQILINLLSNAIKFTERGLVVLRVSVDSESKDGCVVRFAVTDTGIGIPAHRMDRLFRAFSQTDPTTTRVYGGTGLGLAISKQLAELMGGTIGADSEPGCGSTFWFTIRVSGCAGCAEGERTPGDPRGVRVLAVEDNDEQREILRAQIASWGIATEVAPDGETALRMLIDAGAQSCPFRVAIIDGDMPGMNGLELARAIQAREEIRSTVLMLVLPVGTHIEPHRLREMGFCGHLTRPVRQSQLFNAIMDAIASSTTGSTPVRAVTPDPRLTIGSTVGGGRVLLAEDNEVNQLVASEMLRKFGIECEVVRTGWAAVEAVTRRVFDLVLMDCHMPEMDGFDATREIRRLGRINGLARGTVSHLPIVALTANAMKGDRERCLDAGMDAYVSKPINPRQLMETLNTFLKERSMDDTGLRPGVPSPVDCGALLERCMGDVDVAALLLTKLEAQLTHDLGVLEEAVPNRDVEAMASVAHSLKGAAGAVAAESLRAVAASIELAARRGAEAGVEADLARLREEVQRCIAFLPRVRAELGCGVPSARRSGDGAP